MLRFWIHQGSEYASGSDYKGFWICKGSEYARITQGYEYGWIVSEYAWLCPYVSGYAGICLNLPE